MLLSAPLKSPVSPLQGQKQLWKKQHLLSKDKASHRVWWNKSSCKMEEWMKAPKQGLQHMLQEHRKHLKKILLPSSMLQNNSLLIKFLLNYFKKHDGAEFQTREKFSILIIELIYLFTSEKSWSGESLLKNTGIQLPPFSLNRQSENAPLNPALIKFSLNANLHNVILKRLIS